MSKGDHYHHNRSYNIQVTNTGQIFTCNRQHIKPTPITAETYMHYQASKHKKQVHLMPFLLTFEEIHIITQTKLFLMKGMTIKIYMVNMRLETMYKAAEETGQRKYVLIQG